MTGHWLNKQIVMYWAKLKRKTRGNGETQVCVAGFAGCCVVPHRFVLARGSAIAAENLQKAQQIRELERTEVCGVCPRSHCIALDEDVCFLQQRTVASPGPSVAELFGFPSEDDVKAKAASVRAQQLDALNAQMVTDGRVKPQRRLGPDGSLDGEVVQVLRRLFP
jgi:hypothetical protein